MPTSRPVSVWVPGDPVTKGSIRAFTNPKTGRPILTSTGGAKLKNWAQRIALAINDRTRMLHGGVSVTLHFKFRRPKGHYGSGRNAAKLKKSAPKYPIRKRRDDGDKLERAVLDAMTNIAYGDDAQVVDMHWTKRWGDQPGVDIQIEALE